MIHEEGGYCVGYVKHGEEMRVLAFVKFVEYLQDRGDVLGFRQALVYEGGRVVPEMLYVRDPEGADSRKRDPRR